MWMLTIGWLAATTARAECSPNPDLTVCASGCDEATIADAVDVAATNDIVCVDPGLYSGEIIADNKHVRVEASYPGVTIESASGSQIVLVENGADLELVGVDVVGTANRRCLYVTGTGSSLLLDGATVSGCTDNVDGSAIRIEGSTSLTIQNSVLSGNGQGSNSGGHLYANSATSVTVTNSVISGGRADSGAAFRLATTPTTLDDVSFEDNVADNGDGGSILADNSTLTVIGGAFALGTASKDGGCIATTGSAALTITGTWFDGCDSNGHGGGVAHKGSGALVVELAEFTNNSADLDLNNGNGGGLYSTGASTVDLVDSRFDANFAKYGGGLYVTGTGDADVLRSTFTLNDAWTDGGGVVLASTANTSLFANNVLELNTCDGDGGGLYGLTAGSVIRNNAFVDNDCPGGAHDGDGAYFNGGSATFQNNFVGWQVDQGVKKAGGGSFTSSYNAYWSNTIPTSGVTLGAGDVVLAVDPLFYDFTDDGVVNDIFVPNVGSPLIDAGDPALFDADGSTSDVGPFGGPDGVDLDSDGDGVEYPVDCDDREPTTYPGATELVADGRDSNCDGSEQCWQDNDNDGYGSNVIVASAVIDCVGTGVAPVNGDCAVNDATRNPGEIEVIADGADQNCDGTESCYRDNDDDGYGTTSIVTDTDLDCTDDNFQSDRSDDCNDAEAASYPGGPDVVADGIDGDCDGFESCYQDLDTDGYGTTTQVDSADLTCSGTNLATVSTDCDDASFVRHPGAIEVVANGVDEDCVGGDLCWLDTDNDDYGQETTTASADTDCLDNREASVTGDCDDTRATVNPGAIELTADGADQDCDGNELCFADADRDGYGQTGVLESSSLACTASGVAPNDDDCNDGFATVFPGALEIVADGIDQSCDGSENCWADLDSDGFGIAGTTATNGDLDCDDVQESWFSTDCNDGSASINPTAAEITADDIDQNCNGTERCYQDLDNDSYGRTTVVDSTSLTCSAPGVADDSSDCNDGNGTVFPGAPEIPGDGVDQDCSGFDTVSCWLDEDQDGYGVTSDPIVAVDGHCDLGTSEADNDDDCDDGDPTIHPLAPDIPLDGIDQDCLLRDLTGCYQDSDNDGYGDIPAVVVTLITDCGAEANKADNAADCANNNATIHPGAVDVCGDGVDSDCSGANDDDGDGLEFLEEDQLGTDDCNPDTDADGVDDGIEVVADTDPLDDDSDGDTLLDGEEYGGVLPVDTDSDGLVDPLDGDDDDDWVPTGHEVLVGGGDWDNDGIPNHLDPDDDDDTIPTFLEDRDQNHDPTNDDSDGDGEEDWLDDDDDNDGLLTQEEAPVGANPWSADSDADGVPDGVEWGFGAVATDTDGDAAPDLIDADDDNDGIDTLTENTSNPDVDGDSVPNYRDTDSDGDKKLDALEGTGDIDGDLAPNWLDPNDEDGGTGDVDQDGLYTSEELQLGTLPNDPDTDQDGVPDGLEVDDPAAPLDTDGDQAPDVFDTDDDDDSVLTRYETGVLCSDGTPSYDIGYDIFGLVVLCPNGQEPAGGLVFKDTDADGFPNYLDEDDDADGILTVDEDTDGSGDLFDDDADGDGEPDFDDLYGQDGPTGDLDGDGLSNTFELEQGSSPYSDDTDGDGVLDPVEVGDTDQDGEPDFADPDDDGDGWPTAEEGQVDIDGDGDPNYLDDDADGDGILDQDESRADSDCDGVPDRADAEPGRMCSSDGPTSGAQQYVRQACGCATGQGSLAGAGFASGPWLALAIAGLVLGRRRR